MKRGVKTFQFPGDERLANKFLNTEGIVVTINERHFAQKTGVIILYLEYEDYRDNEDDDYDEDIEDEGEFYDGP
jgi:hypothetical protein